MSIFFLSIHFKNIQLEFITNSIKSFSQNTDTETFTISIFSTFFIIIYDNIQTETEEAVMTEYH